MKKYKLSVKISKLIVVLLFLLKSCQLVAIPRIIKAHSFLSTVGQMEADYQNLIHYYIAKYYKDSQLPGKIRKSANYLQYILIELKKRNLPVELALLPIIESSCQLCAVSKQGAYGIWQISYNTGKRYGLIFAKKDIRNDLIASTNAALNYLEFLYKKFNKDWLLALAAYNAGEGRISKAINHNKFIGENTNFWNLNLPKETKHYVPKLIALAIIFSNTEY